MTANRLLGEGGELIRFCQPVAIVLRRRTAWHITSGGFLLRGNSANVCPVQHESQ